MPFQIRSAKPMKHPRLILLALFVPSAASAQSEGVDLFERKIRPVLVEHCYGCHSAEAQRAKNLRGGLFLDTRAGVLKGGESGPALVPGKPAESLLLKAMRHTEERRMPPKTKLPASVIDDFERW